MAGKAPSQRQLRVGELVRHALSDVLNRDAPSDPGLDGKVISVSEVRMSPDLKIATVFVTALGETDAGPVSKALARNAKFLRGRMTGQLKQMKFMPDLRFLPDESFENFAKVDKLLRSDTVSRDLEIGGDSKDEI